MSGGRSKHPGDKSADGVYLPNNSNPGVKTGKLPKGTKPNPSKKGKGFGNDFGSDHDDIDDEWEMEPGTYTTE